MVLIYTQNLFTRIPLKQARRSPRTWSDRSLLKSIPNPSKRAYEIKVKNPEITFLGVQDQPDYAIAHILFYPGDRVIELRSLKLYFHQFRTRVISYERLINVVYDDLLEVYRPKRLRLVMTFNPRGGISSRLTIDSDWKIRGGREQFKDWLGQPDEW